MPTRMGTRTILLPNRPCVCASAAVGTTKEAQGPLGEEFDSIYPDASAGEKTWEKAESAMHREAVRLAIRKAGLDAGQIQLLLAGDLLNQCIGTSFGVRELAIPFAGMYGACSTMALTMGMAGILTDCGAVQTAVASTSSHFCAAEKQFRMPLEYGGQRPPTAQWTASASGAAVLTACGNGPRVKAVTFGRITDYGVCDANNMGAAMAPAACDTIAAFLRDMDAVPQDFDMILTGDLGSVGTRLLTELTEKEYGIDIRPVHADCGLLLYDRETQDVHAGGSGCGCSGAVVCSYILRRLREGSLKNVLFVGTGALLSAVSSLQGESVPGIAHGVWLSQDEGKAVV